MGYVGAVSEDDLAEDAFPGIQPGDLVGRTGVERTYNQCLTGENGARQVIVDSLGRELGQLDEKPAVIGGDLQLTLDYDLQNEAETLLADNVGAIVAMDPRNGEILAMADASSFNPNSFSPHISAKDWNELVNDPNHPLQNGAIQNTYPPGSIFKLAMAETGLDEGFVDESTHVICHGSAVSYNSVFHCWSETGHGYVNLEATITHSCNIFFNTLGERMGIDLIAKHAKALGFGAQTGIDLPGEHEGVVPSPEWKMQTRGEKWFAGETISVAIGRGPIRATPLQVLHAVCAIFTDGMLVTPHLLLRAERGPAPDQWPVQQLPIKPESASRIRAGMWGSVNKGGTGHGAALPGLDICGKTGTVQVISAERKKELNGDLSGVENHAWPCGFASRDNPEIAIVVFLVLLYFDYHIYTDYIAFAYLAGLVVLCLVFVIGHTVHANKSWLTLGLFHFQPSELVKVLVIAALAKYYAEIKRDYLELRELATGGMIVFGPMRLLMLQGDLGTAITFVPIAGIPLPFVSAGGSSLLSFYAAMNLGMNVNMRRSVN